MSPYGAIAPRMDMYAAGWFDPTTSGAVYGTGYAPNPFAGGFSPVTGGFSPALYGATYGATSTTGEQLGDREIENLIDDILDADPLTCNADIQVQCQGHVVTLSGTVVGRLSKIAAGNDAWSIPGVRDVNNNIDIKSRSPQGNKQRQTTGTR
jgi:BON domain